VIAAAQELHVAVRQHTGEVAGAVDPFAGRAWMGMRLEAVGGQVGPAEVASGQQPAAQEDLAGHAGRHRL
jgi:hypothetical protein